jgi:hypothetical protein
MAGKRVRFPAGATPSPGLHPDPEEVIEERISAGAEAAPGEVVGLCNCGFIRDFDDAVLVSYNYRSIYSSL